MTKLWEGPRPPVTDGTRAGAAPPLGVTATTQTVTSASSPILLLAPCNEPGEEEKVKRGVPTYE